MGFDGDYLFDRHTRRHARELWKAQLAETGTFDGWVQAGRPSTLDKAQTTVREILAASPSRSRMISAGVRRHHRRGRGEAAG